MIELSGLLKKLINWFLNKSNVRLETLTEEEITGDGIILRRYKRKTARAYRTWKAVYKSLDYDIIIAFDYLGYIPDVPVKKSDRLATHSCYIYRQGYHARFNGAKGIHEPDIEVLVQEEVRLELPWPNMERAVAKWQAFTRNSKNQINSSEDLVNRIIDEVAKHAIQEPPSRKEPTSLAWREIIRSKAKTFLGKTHEVYAEDSGTETKGTSHPTWLDNT